MEVQVHRARLSISPSFRQAKVGPSVRVRPSGRPTAAVNSSIVRLTGFFPCARVVRLPRAAATMSPRGWRPLHREALGSLSQGGERDSAARSTDSVGVDGQMNDCPSGDECEVRGRVLPFEFRSRPSIWRAGDALISFNVTTSTPAKVNRNLSKYPAEKPTFLGTGRE